MKAVTWSLFYAVIGAVFLCVGTFQSVGFYLLLGGGFLLLGAWEAWTSIRGQEMKGPSGWRLSQSLAFLLIAACFVYRGVAEPTGDHVGAAVIWAVLGAVYGGKTAWQFYAAKAGTKKKEGP